MLVRQRGVGLDEYRGGDFESFDAAEFGVLVLDVDQHAGVDFLQGAEELGPERDVVALAEGDEVPGGVGGPFVGPFVAAEVGAGFVWGESTDCLLYTSPSPRD